MAETGKSKSKKIIRGAGDDDRHVHSDIRQSAVATPLHLAYDQRFREQARALREPFKTIVTGGDFSEF